jgi:hypothetical protein
MPTSRTPKSSRRELTPAERDEILGAYRAGAKASEMPSRLGHKRGAVYYTIAKAAERVDNKSKPRSRQRKTDSEKDEQPAKAALGAPARPLRELNRNVVPDVAVRTVQRRLKETIIKQFRARRKKESSCEATSARLSLDLGRPGHTFSIYGAASMSMQPTTKGKPMAPE